MGGRLAGGLGIYGSCTWVTKTVSPKPLRGYRFYRQIGQSAGIRRGVVSPSPRAVGALSMRGNRILMAALFTACGISMVPAVFAERDERKVVEFAPGDPDAGMPTEILLPDDGSFSILAGTGCELISATPTTAPTGNSILRGNAFRLSRPSDLSEIQMELNFGTAGAPVPANASFSIHKNIGTSANPIWDHVWSQNPNIVLLGTGRKFYSSGTITPPTLASGVEYFIGITWANVNIQYFRDSRTYPQPYSDGLVLGSAGSSIPGGPPIDQTADFFFVPFTGGAYSMQLCIVPKPGACCINFLCNDTLTKDQCSAQGGNFAEELMTCAQLGALGGCPLPTAACCLGESCSTQTEYDCDRLGGVWQELAACATAGDNPCLPQGACCSSSGSCTEESRINCETVVDGVYQGDGTTCAGVGSACQLGACCKNGVCNYVSRPTCAANTGFWRGAGTNCGGDECDPTGACCAGQNCAGNADAVTSSECQTEGGVYQGDWTSCSSRPADCGKGACCTSSFGCISNVDMTICTGVLSGSFRGIGTSCDTLNPPCSGTCCFQNSCLPNPASPVQCAALPGVFVGYGPDAVCSANTCSAASGRCCMPTTGACFVTTSNGCADLGGAFSAGGTCTTNTCPQPGLPGACCLANGYCVELIASKCTAEGGVFSGAGTDCSLELCATGACCPGNGGACVSNSTVAACNASNGTYFSGETCATTTCPAVGACCMPNATCQKITQANCTSMNGIYAGDNVNCFPGIAGQTQCTRRSCCLMDGTCATTIPTRCSAMGGKFDNTSGPCSSANPCGACCNGGGCQVVTDFVCNTGYHSGEGTSCLTTPPLCELGTCCTRDGACTEVTETECSDMQGLFGRGLTCAANPCPATGACCKSTSTCELILEFACTAEGGTYLGDNSTCVAGECDRGACCLPNGTCADNIASQCAAMGGEFNVIDDCASFPCPQTGACCINGSCQVLTPFGCGAAGGSFDVPGGTCVAGLCNAGACCARDGTCTNTTVTPCVSSGGNFMSGADCAASPCPPVGACCKANPECEVISAATCASEGGSYAGNGTNCSSDICTPSVCCPAAGQTCSIATRLFCEQNAGTYVPGEVCPAVLPDPSNPCITGGCCRLDGTCQVGQIASECQLPDEFHPNMNCLIDFTCEARGACCSASNVCTIQAAIDCIGQGVQYFGDGVSCSPDPCNPIQIVSANPPSKAIDARRPHAVGSALPAEGIIEIDITFDNDVTVLTVGDFAVTQSGGDNTPPSILSLTPQSAMVLRLTFSAPIDPLAWTVIQHVDSGTQTCLGYLPGDVSGNSLVETADVTALLADLALPALPAYAVDTNRSGLANGEDIIELVNLLNGADAFGIAAGLSLPASPCP